jgi:hypothetical protein
LWSSLAAQHEGGVSIALSPAASSHEHDAVYRYQRDGYASIVYTGFGATGAALVGVRSSDALIIGCGGIVSPLEVITALEEEKPIGILEGAWQQDPTVAEVLEAHALHYPFLFIHEDPKELISLLKRAHRARS